MKLYELLNRINVIYMFRSKKVHSNYHVWDYLSNVGKLLDPIINTMYFSLS